MDRFARVFREEHRAIRDALLALSDALEAGDDELAGALVGTVATLTGPHFRYEEESLYPSLVQIFGPDYIERLLTDHDGAIAAARELAALAGRAPLDADGRARGAALARGLLPHVSDCEGLSIMVERLPGGEVDAILAARDRARGDGLDLLRWADGVRARPAAPAAA